MLWFSFPDLISLKFTETFVLHAWQCSGLTKPWPATISHANDAPFKEFLDNLLIKKKIYYVREIDEYFDCKIFRQKWVC